MREHERYLEHIAAQYASCDPDDYYLWPNTPVKNLQAEIWRRVGVSDHRFSSPESRPYRIAETIRELLDNSLLNLEFSVLDICCGDALVSQYISQRFPTSECYGLDVHLKNVDGIQIYRGTIQHLFAEQPEVPFDLAIMLNTYRGWDSAGLRKSERNLPEQVDAWFKECSRYIFITATEWQIHHLRREGFWTIDLGRGEDDSRLICMFYGGQ